MSRSADTIIDALSDEEILYSDSLATVTRNWIIIPDPTRRSQTIIPLARLSEVNAIKVSYPGLLVVASGLFVLAAAAFCSKEGSGAGIPITLVGVGSVIAYLVSHRAWVAFTVGSAVTNTIAGTHKAADELAAVVQSVQADLIRATREQSELAS